MATAQAWRNRCPVDNENAILAVWVKLCAMDPRRLARLSARHGALFTRQEAQRCGYSTKQIRRRILNGEWVQLFHQVLAPAGLVLTPQLRDTAAQLAIPGSVLAGPSAARRWRFPVSDAGTYLYVGPNGKRALPGVRQLRTMPDERDLGKHGIVPITWHALTVVDCLVILAEREAIELLDRALLKRWITIDELKDHIQRRIGRKDVRRLVRLLRVVVDGTRSAAERLAAELFRLHGVTGWTANAPIYDKTGLIGLADFVFPPARVIVEVDGWAFHHDPTRFVVDRERQNRLVRAGWRLVRVTWYDLRYRPDYVVSQVREALAQAA
jgi:hypothetical protein